MIRLAVVALALSLICPAAEGLAQDAGYPDMRGRWLGTNDGVVLGSGLYHRETGKAGEPRTVRKEFTITIKGQDGAKFWGEIAHKDETGPVLGVVASDRQTLHMVDNAGGLISGKLVAPTRFEMCYTRASREIMVAACNVHTKQ